MRGYLRTRAPADRGSASRPAALFLPHRRPSSWSSSSLGHVLLTFVTLNSTGAPKGQRQRSKLLVLLRLAEPVDASGGARPDGSPPLKRAGRAGLTQRLTG